MCLITFVFSFAAMLSVAFRIPPYENTLTESSLNVSAGDEVSVRCSLTCGSLCPTARVAWFDSDLNEISRSSADDVWQDSVATQQLSTLKIKSASQANTGEYVCRVRISEEETTYTSFMITLQG